MYAEMLNEAGQLADLAGSGGDWRDLALCAFTDPDISYPDKGESPRTAKKVCSTCEVRAECLQDALDHHEQFGVWGGLSERERRVLARQPNPVRHCPAHGQAMSGGPVLSPLPGRTTRALSDRRRPPGGRRDGDDDAGRVTVRRDYGPIQLAVFLGLAQWQLDRALGAGLIPRPDTSRGRWSAAAAEAAITRIEEIRAEVGGIPDLGAVRTAGLLSERLGVEVTGDGVAELGRRGLLPVTGDYKGWPLYDGRAIEVFTDTAAVADANRAGRLRAADESAAYLRIRRSDFGHLVRAGLVTPTDWGHGPFDRRRQFSVPLYRTGDLDALASLPGIDWDAVRAVPAGHRSPLAALPSHPVHPGK